jgi:hypothetical protein
MIKIEDGNFKDEMGRTLLLRGVNLGGSSKVPCIPDGSTFSRSGFYDHRNVSFVGRPFPLSEADQHFSRLQAWGFTFLRFLVTWEAIEHAGPGIYDQDYLDYLRAVLDKAGEYGIRVFIDPHQDVWSRFSGGDGAPGWTLELAGFELTRLHAAGAAILHQEHGDPFPRMIWPTNYNKLAAATMFTLFFGGNDFAPDLKVGGMPIQEYLQSHYIEAIKQVARKLTGLPNVVGYDTLNEPSSGYIGASDMDRPASAIHLFMGETPTIFQSMLMGSGYPQMVDHYDLGVFGFHKTGKKLGNPRGTSAWVPGCIDIWRQHGVWDLDSNGQPEIRKPDYFLRAKGRQVDFHQDYFKPFANRFAREIRSVDPDTIIFVEGVPSQGELTWTDSDAPAIVHAAHWYDDLTLVKKRYTPWMAVDAEQKKLVFGPGRVRRSLRQQLGRLVERSIRQMNRAATLVGEVGIPFDMQDGKAYRSGDFSMQLKAMDATMTALERNFISFTLWNYTSDNINLCGDRWNGEDLSIFSRDQMTGSGGINDGGRALKAAVRPYPMMIAGKPLSLVFDMKSGRFEFVFEHSAGLNAVNQIFVPQLQYPRGFTVEVTDGQVQTDPVRQLLSYQHSADRTIHTIKIFPRKQ